MQQNQPVAYASRAMSNSEVNYAQIEKQLLAIIFGCERFGQFTMYFDVFLTTNETTSTRREIISLKLQNSYMYHVYVFEYRSSKSTWFS